MEDAVNVPLSDHEDEKEQGNETKVDGSLFFFTVHVHDPSPDETGSFLLYEVTARSSLPVLAHLEEISYVKRRYRDFVWLQGALQHQFKSSIVPPLPEKSVLTDRFNEEFVEKRRKKLDTFLKKVAAHKKMRFSKDLWMFLDKVNGELPTSTNITEDAVGALSGWGAALGRWGSNLLQGGTPERDEDQWLDTCFGNLDEMEGTLTKAAEGGREMVTRYRDIGKASSTFSAAMIVLSNSSLIEDHPALGEGLHKLGITVNDQPFVELSTGVYDCWEDPLGDTAAEMQCARRMLKQREEAEVELLVQQRTLQKKREALAGVGTTEDRAQERKRLESEVHEAEAVEERLSNALETIKEDIHVEMSRFSDVVRDTIRLGAIRYADHHITFLKKSLALWEGVLDKVRSISPVDVAVDEEEQKME